MASAINQPSSKWSRCYNLTEIAWYINTSSNKWLLSGYSLYADEMTLIIREPYIYTQLLHRWCLSCDVMTASVITSCFMVFFTLSSLTNPNHVAWYQTSYQISQLVTLHFIFLQSDVAATIYILFSRDNHDRQTMHSHANIMVLREGWSKNKLRCWSISKIEVNQGGHIKFKIIIKQPKRKRQPIRW